LDTKDSVTQPYRPSGDEDFLRQLLRLLAGSASAGKFEELLARPELSALPESTREQLKEDVQLALHVRRLLQQHQRRESELLALYETAQDLTALRDLDQVLQAIVRRARQLIGTDIAYLSVYDEELDDYYVRATEGTYSEAFGRIRVPRGIGICDLVGSTCHPYFSSGYLQDERFPHSGSIDAAVQEEEIVSILGVPLQADTRVLGVLFVANRFARSFSQQEVALLSSLAAHAALAIENARMFEDTQKAMRQVSKANELLEARAKEVERAAIVHEQLTALVVRGGDLKGLAAMVAEALSGRVAILDEGLHVICTADASEDREEASAPSAELKPFDASEPIRLALQESRKTGRSVEISMDESIECRVASMVGGSRFLGGLILWTDRALPDIDVRTFERSAMVTAAVLMSQERVMEAEYRDVSDILTGLLKEPQDTERLAREVAKRGFDLTQRATLLLIDIPSGRNSYTLRLIRKVFTPDEQVLAGELNGDVAILMPCEEPRAAAERVHKFISDSLGEVATVAASNFVSGPANFPGAYRAARRCVALLKALGKSGGVGTEAELGLYGLVFGEQGRPELEAYLRDTIWPLLEHDNSRNTELARTLLVYFDHGRSTRETAKALHVHVNTVRQRLEQVTQILGQWDAPTQSLEIHMALRLHQLYQQALPSP
jgi:sugar diacid utilization regulator